MSSPTTRRPPTLLMAIVLVEGVVLTGLACLYLFRDDLPGWAVRVGVALGLVVVAACLGGMALVVRRQSGRARGD